MKLYNENQTEKSWAIKLAHERQGQVILKAVDSETGKEIRHLIIFEKNGKIFTSTGAMEGLIGEGYDPYEHNNRFDEDGSISVK